jgi:hypothetical protein
MIKLNPQATEFDGEKLFLLEGVIADLQVAPSTENLLEQIQQGSKDKAALVGAAAGLVGMSQIVATSSALVFYDGEDTNNFAALIKNKGVVCGTFRAADSLVKGEQVKCVVSKRGDVYFAHAVLRVQPDLIMVPNMTSCGEGAYFRAGMRSAFNAALLGWIVFLIFLMYQYFIENSPVGIGLITTGTLMAFFLSFSVELWTIKSTRYWGLHASAIFKALGIPKPDDFSLLDHWKREFPRGAFCLESALKAHIKSYPEINQQNS